MNTQRFDRIVHIGFFVVLLACTWRYLWWSGLVEKALPVVSSAALYGLLYLVPLPRRIWLAVLIAGWVGLTLLAASYTWVAVPLFFLVLRVFPVRIAIPVIIAITGFAAIEGSVHARQAWDPSPIIAPVAIAVLAAIVFRHLHAAGMLEERVRLSREIHDTLAQGLSSMHLLLNAADQEWDAAPDRARGHVRQAARAAQENLAEARRFIRDLTPPALDDSSLPDALLRLCAGVEEMTVHFRLDGEQYPMHVDAEIALLRVAQGALANVRQHSQATCAVVTLAYLNDELTLDVCDNGVGFDPGTQRGFGLRATSQRVEALGGRVTVESVPGEGTALGVSVPIRSSV